MTTLASNKCPIPSDVLSATMDALKPFEKCKLTSYWDKVGKVWTIGWGETGEDIHVGMTWNQTKADFRLGKRIAQDYEYLCHYSPTIPLEHFKLQAAILDFVYNCGIGTYTKSKVLKQAVDDRAWDVVANILPQFNHGADSKPSDGLTRRRAAEVALIREVKL